MEIPIINIDKHNNHINNTTIMVTILISTVQATLKITKLNTQFNRLTRIIMRPIRIILSTTRIRVVFDQIV